MLACPASAAHAAPSNNDTIPYDAATARRVEVARYIKTLRDNCSRNVVAADLARGVRSRAAIRADAVRKCVASTNDVGATAAIAEVTAMTDSWIDTIVNEGHP
jgi:hypothetical protein